MDEVTQQSPAPNKLSKEERSRIMKEAATRRWAKARKEKAKAKSAKAAPTPTPKKAVQGKKPAATLREFSSALKTAEKRLASAILESAKASATYAVLSAEIPSLRRLIVALKNPLGVLPEYGGVSAGPSLAQIVGDEPLGYTNPPRASLNAPVAPELVPNRLHPANTMGRAGGGAIGVEIAEAEEDEDRFLKESNVAGGEWH